MRILLPLLLPLCSCRAPHQILITATGRITSSLVRFQRPSFQRPATHWLPSGKMTANEQEVSFPSPGSRNTPSILFCLTLNSFSSLLPADFVSTASPAQMPPNPCHSPAHGEERGKESCPIQSPGDGAAAAVRAGTELLVCDLRGGQGLAGPSGDRQTRGDGKKKGDGRKEREAFTC